MSFMHVLYIILGRAVSSREKTEKTLVNHFTFFKYELCYRIYGTTTLIKQECYEEDWQPLLPFMVLFVIKFIFNRKCIKMVDGCFAIEVPDSSLSAKELSRNPGTVLGIYEHYLHFTCRNDDVKKCLLCSACSIY